MTWQPTYSGIMINPLELQPSDVMVEDIAHALANKCRWTGHTPRFYSVAEHSCYVADYLADRGMTGDALLWALLHDATEAYLPDVAGWLKPHIIFRLGPPPPVDWVDPPLTLTFRELEDRILEAIAGRLALDLDLHHATASEVQRADKAVTHAEALIMFPHVPGPWPKHWPSAADVPITGWQPHQAKSEFRLRFAEYSAGRYSKWLAG